jgi:hypothetical protein
VFIGGGILRCHQNVRRRKLGFWLLDRNSVRSSNDNSSGNIAEKSVVNNTTDVLDIFGHLSWVLDASFEVEVDNVVAIVCHGDLITIGLVAGRRSHSENSVASLARWQSSDLSHSVFMAERSDFYRDWEARSKCVRKFGFVNCSSKSKASDFMRKNCGRK